MPVEINNPAMYKPCKYKKYSAFACMPDINTVVVDSVKYPEVAQLLETSFIAARDLPYYAARLTEIRGRYPASLAHVTDETPVVLGIESAAGLELTTISVRQFFTRYRTSSGASSSLGQLKKGWVKVQYEPNPAEKYSACFVPASEVGVLLNTGEPYNKPGARHGMGDFIVARVHDGDVLSSRFVVSGLVFGAMFNNSGFTQFLVKDAAESRKVSLPNPTKIVPIQKYSFAELQERVIKHEHGTELMMSVPAEYTFNTTTLSVLAWMLTLGYLSFVNSFGSLIALRGRGAVRKNGDLMSSCRIGYNQPNGFDMCMLFESKTPNITKRMQMNWHVDITGISVRVEGQFHGSGTGVIIQSTKDVRTPYDAQIGNIASSEGAEFCISNQGKISKWFSDYIKNWWDSK